jgi:hypothetical protein
MATKLTRRQLGLAGLAAAAAPAPASAAYTGALDGTEGKLDPKTFDPLVWARGRYESARPLRAPGLLESQPP